MGQIKAKDFEDLRKILKSKLLDFLDEKGIEKRKGSSNVYRSFYPDTIDKNPSLYTYEGYSGDQMYYCFSTHRSGDIFIANNIITGAPLAGHRFITENVKPLAEMFDVQYDFKPLSEEEIEEMNIRSLYSIVKDMTVSALNFGIGIDKFVDDKVLSYMDDKNIKTQENIKKYSLGYVPNWNNFLSQIVSFGFDKDYVEAAGIKKFLFNPGNLIFSIFDERGHVSGFASRNCLFDEENKVGAKYYNSENNIVYHKSKLLYNLNRANKQNVGQFNSLYITEGYTDAIALDKLGLRAVAIGSTKFTNDHIALLQRVSETDIVFLLDGDQAGIDNTARAVTEVMENIRNFRVRIVTLPGEDDPDSFVRANGIEKLLDLPHVTAFEWRLAKLQAETDLTGHELADRMIPLIVNEQSSIQRDRMSINLAELSGVPVNVVRREVESIASNDQLKVQAEQDAIVDNVVKSLRTNPTDAQVILSHGLDSIRYLQDKHGVNKFGEDETLNFLQALKTKQETDADRDFFYLWRMPRLEQRMMGSMAGKFIVIGGQAHSGKTTFCVNMALGLLRSSEAAEYHGQVYDEARENDITVIYHTIDDSRSEMIPRFQAALGFDVSPEATIVNMDAPYKFDVSSRDELLKSREYANKKLEDWIKDGKLFIKDVEVGNTLSAAENMIRYVKSKYPQRHIVYIVDNMYNLADFPNYESDTKRIKEISRILKQDLATKYGITVVATAEYKKTQVDTSTEITYSNANSMIKDTGSIVYHANFIGHLLNELHTNNNTDMWFYDPFIPESQRTTKDKLSIIRLLVSKNKINGWLGELHYFLLGKQSTYLEVTRNDVIQNMSEGVRKKIGAWYKPNEFTSLANSKKPFEFVPTEGIFENEDTQNKSSAA